MTSLVCDIQTADNYGRMQVITGGAVASVLISLASRHPFDPAKPLLDFDMALMLTSPLLLGVSVGASCHTRCVQSALALSMFRNAYDSPSVATAVLPKKPICSADHSMACEQSSWHGTPPQVMSPMQPAAAGVLLNTVLPDWLITFLLTALLLWLTYRTFRKSLSLHQASRHLDI